MCLGGEITVWRSYEAVEMIRYRRQATRIIIIIIIIIIIKYVSNIPGNHEVKELQKTAILGTAHILRKVLS
jgi:hypothetical protein